MKIDTKRIHDVETLVQKSKGLEGKMLYELYPEIVYYDEHSRVKTKGSAGYVVESVFGIDTNSDALPDIAKLGVEIKTSPLKFIDNGRKLTVKEPLSANIINYFEEIKNDKLTDSSFYKKSKTILFFWYIHDTDRLRSQYLMKYIFLWKMDKKVIKELEPDYQKILTKIREGKAHEIHQTEHQFLTLCPKHNGNFKDPNCSKSKRKQPYSDDPAEVRAFRLKNRYMKLVIRRYLGLEEKPDAWPISEQERRAYFTRELPNVSPSQKSLNGYDDFN